MGQFESDNAMDEQLEAIYLEGNGGGQMRETYELAAYYLARHTYLETFEKHGKKGYAFFIGDEMPYDIVKRVYSGYYGQQHTLESLIGDRLEADIPTEQIFNELKEKFHVFFLFQKQGSYHEDEILPAWRKLLGEQVQVLEDPAAVCEFIASILAVLEGGVDLDEAEADMLALGMDPATVKAAKRAASKALATLAATAGSTAVARAEGNLPAPKDNLGGATRL
jgi:hypothetical protein